jgi:hypothetical protein
VKIERGAVTDAPPKKISRHQATDQPQHNAADLYAVPVARGIGLAPSGARKLWLWIVGSCVFCAGAHAHRGGPKCGVRRAGCGNGEYEVMAGRRA